MLKIFRNVAAIVALAAFAGGAQADAVIGATDSYDFGVLSSSRGVSVGDPVFGFSGAFDNTFSFTQGAYPGAAGAVAGFDLVGDMIAQFRVKYGASDWSAWSAPVLVPQNPETGFFAFSQTINGLTPGQTYAFGLKGTASQAAYSVTLAPVPEPESWALLLSGLGLMGFVVRRRSNSSAA